LPKAKSIVGVIHARMGSSRFPGKMLADLGGYPILEWVVRRAQKTRSIERLILATSDLAADTVLHELGTSLDIEVFRGSHEDVLRRVLDAARPYEPDALLRICADNPFVDSELLDELVMRFRHNWSDYAFNHRPGLGLQVADGFGGEVFDAAVLATIPTRFENRRYREHLTSPFWDHQHLFSIQAVEVQANLRHPHLRFDVDTPDDLSYLNFLVEKGHIQFDSPASRIVEVALSV
jgi:spore coat polysaccharide biosynthesis protein SpsF